MDSQNKDFYSAEIMVVDDNPSNLKLLMDILSYEGYKVRVVNGGDLALRSVAYKIPDLIILDINMIIYWYLKQMMANVYHLIVNI